MTVAGVCLIGAIALAVMNMFGGVEPGSPLPPDKTTTVAPATSPASGTPVNKNVIPQLQPGQRGGSRTATERK